MQTPEIITKSKWIVDQANSQIGFRVKYFMFTNVRGSGNRKGVVQYEWKNQ